MTILTHRLHLFVNEALKEAGHSIINTGNSQKLQKILMKHHPDASIIFGWDKNCQKFIETYDPVFLRKKHLQFLNRRISIQALNDVASVKYQKRYYIAAAADQKARVDDFESFLSQEDSVTEWVMKWGDFHQKNNKRLVTYPKNNLLFSMLPKEEVILEPFVIGRSIRVLIIQGSVWTIEHVNKKNWIKNIDPDKEIINPDGVPSEMIDQAKAVSTKYDLDLVGIDFQLGTDGSVFPLDIHVMPDIPDHEEIKREYIQYFLNLVK